MVSITGAYDISAVIPNYCGCDLLRRHLPVLRGCAKTAALAVVDDASTDGSVEMLREEFPEATVIAREANGGFSAAANDGIRAARSEFVLLLNNDVEVTPGFLDAIMPLFEDESVFAVSPKIVLPSHHDLDEGAKTGFWHHGMFYPDQRQGVDEVVPILFTTGCSAVYRRSMLDTLGGFDEAYSPFYWEDADLGYRAWKRGWKSLYQPASVVYHQHSASISRMDQKLTKTVTERNGFFFIWRNIDDSGLLLRHRLWLPLVIARRAAAGDTAFVSGWREAFRRRQEALSARRRDSQYRKVSDRSIFAAVGIKV